MLLADLRQAREAVHLRHSEVEQDEVRLQPLDEREDLGTVRGLADDREAAGLLERALGALDDEPVIIRNEDPHAAISLPQSIRATCAVASLNLAPVPAAVPSLERVMKSPGQRSMIGLRLPGKRRDPTAASRIRFCHELYTACVRPRTDGRDGDP